MNYSPQNNIKRRTSDTVRIQYVHSSLGNRSKIAPSWPVGLWNPNHSGAVQMDSITCQFPKSTFLNEISMADSSDVSLSDFQRKIRAMYYDKDVQRGIDGTFMWLVEEVGELATALRQGTHREQSEEFADVLAWLATIANVAGVDLGQAIQDKYGTGCPGCHRLVCTCPLAEKP